MARYEKQIGIILASAAAGALTMNAAMRKDEYRETGAKLVDYTQTRIALIQEDANRFEVQISPPESERIIFDSQEPSADMIQELSNNVVRVQTYMPAEYGSYGFKTYGCTGTIIRDGNDNPIVLTAKHCFPPVIEANDGTMYGSRNDNGSSMLKSQIITKDNIILDTTIDNFYLNSPDARRNDAVVLSINTPELIHIPSLSVGETDNLTLGQRATLLTLSSEGSFNPAPVYLIKKDDGLLQFLSFPDEKEDCISGTSGSSIIDNSGKMIGYHVASGDKFQISQDFISLYHLPNELEGRTADMCIAITPETIQGLIRNP